MSSPPTKYLRYFDFTTFATLNPEKPLPGASVDVEFNRLKTTTDQTIDRLALIQRDDGSLSAVIGTAQLADGSVTTPKLADAAVTNPKLARNALDGMNSSFNSIGVGTGYGASGMLIVAGQAQFFGPIWAQDATFNAGVSIHGAFDVSAPITFTGSLTAQAGTFNDVLQAPRIGLGAAPRANNFAVDVQGNSNQLWTIVVKNANGGAAATSSLMLQNDQNITFQMFLTSSGNGNQSLLYTNGGSMGFVSASGPQSQFNWQAAGVNCLHLDASGLNIPGNLTVGGTFILPPGSISGSGLADGSVPGAKLVPGSVGTLQLADGGTTLAKMAPNSVDSSKIVDGSVEPVDFSAASIALMTAAGNPRGAWATGVNYATKDAVTNGNGVYVAIAAHTSGVFATDLAAGKWYQTGQIFDQSLNKADTVQFAYVKAANVIAPNKIINGDFRIDQRRGGAAFDVPPGYNFVADRWYAASTQNLIYRAGQNLDPMQPPEGALAYIGARALVNYAVVAGDRNDFEQTIEDKNINDAKFGYAWGRPLTLSFYVRASVTGNFGGAINNNYGTRSYPFLYAINAANTWEYKTITIPPDLTGTWDHINLRLAFGTGSQYSGPAGAWAAGDFRSANGAVNVLAVAGQAIYFTQVKLELGSVATPFTMDDYNTLLAKCQRYYYRTPPHGIYSYYPVAGMITAAEAGLVTVNVPVPMRATPTIGIGAMSVQSGSRGWAVASLAHNLTSTGPSFVLNLALTTGAGMRPGDAVILQEPNGPAGVITFDAEI